MFGTYDAMSDSKPLAFGVPGIEAFIMITLVDGVSHYCLLLSLMFMFKDQSWS